MALQNHAPLIKTWKDTLDLVREVNSPWLKMCLDLPIMDNLDKDYVANAVRTVGDLQVHSHFGGEYYRDKDGTVKPVILVFISSPLDHFNPDGIIRLVIHNVTTAKLIQKRWKSYAPHKISFYHYPGKLKIHISPG